MKRVLITGITGTLGTALGKAYLAQGWEVIGVSRRDGEPGERSSRHVVNSQETLDDAKALLALDPDVIFLNAGAIEKEVGEKGLPLPEGVELLYRVNSVFPSLVAAQAATEERERPLDVIAVGSIADGSPSAFGPVYHASKIALHYFFTGVGPIARGANANIRLRLYRPGAIRGPLAWAPVLRLNERGYKIRAKRCQKAPTAERVAEKMVRFQASDRWVGTYDEPLSFRFLRLFFALTPNLYYRAQILGWKKASRYMGEGNAVDLKEAPHAEARELAS